MKPAPHSSELTDEEVIHEMEMNDETIKHREARAASPCYPNLCLNGGVCVESSGKATCRFVVLGQLTMKCH